MGNSNCVHCNQTVLRNYIKTQSYNYRQCCSCGLVQLVPMPTTEELSKYYSESYYKEKKYTNLDKLREERLEKQILEKYSIVRRINDRKDIQILDFGAGMGGFLLKLKELGYQQLFAYEFNEYACQVLNEKGIKIIDPNKQIECYNIITLWDVAEHLNDPNETLKNLYNLLKPGGTLIIGTTSINDFLDKVSFGYTMWMDPPAHTILYSKETLKLCLKNVGFKEVRNCKHGIGGSRYFQYKYILKSLAKLILFYRSWKEAKIIKRASYGNYLLMKAKRPN